MGLLSPHLRRPEPLSLSSQVAEKLSISLSSSTNFSINYQKFFAPLACYAFVGEFIIGRDFAFRFPPRWGSEGEEKKKRKNFRCRSVCFLFVVEKRKWMAMEKRQVRGDAYNLPLKPFPHRDVSVNFSRSSRASCL